MNKSVLIIAEAGVNHNGDLEIAKNLIEVASKAGADYVKFQTFKTQNLVSKSASKADYQKNSTKDGDSQFEMLKKLELSETDHYILLEYCKKCRINFLSTAFDLQSLDFLNQLGLDLFKIPSGEITNRPYLEAVGRLNRRVIISTGMSEMYEITEAITVLLESGTLKENITILHCNTEYPTPFEDVNLRAMNSLAADFGVQVGYSDHTKGIEVSIAAVALGAKVIEKHFTLSREMEGPDHGASLEPLELSAMINSIRNIEKALGVADKKVTDSERKNINIARKSIHALSNLQKGHILSESDLIMKRPGDGISPMKIKEVVGRKLKHDINGDHKLRFDDLI